MGKNRYSKQSNTKDQRSKERWQKDKNGRTKDDDRGGRVKESKLDCFPYNKEKFNDFSWYDKNPSLTKGVGRIQFVNKPGMDITTGSLTTITSSGGMEVHTYAMALPGIMRLSWIPSIGICSNPNDPINVAANEVYARVRNAFSGDLKADAPDFMVYFMTLDSIFSYIGALKRLYRVVTSYSPENYLVPNCMLRALGVVSDANMNNLKSNLDRLWTNINELIGMTRRYKCPALFPIFNRHYWMNDNVYTDANSLNSQWYTFFQTDYYKFSMLPVVNSTSGATAGGLTLVSQPFSSNATSSDIDYTDMLFNYGKALFAALASYETAYDINGYLARAYGDQVNFTVEPLSQFENFTPVYEEQVLRQIENAHVCEFSAQGVNTNVQQNVGTNSLVCAMTCSINVPAQSKVISALPILTSRMEDPTVEDVVESSRLCSYAVPESYASAVGKLTYRIIAGTEWLWGLDIFTFSPIDGSYVWVKLPQSTLLSSNKDADWVNFILFTSYLSQFDWHPNYVQYYSLGSSSGAVPYCDLHNVTTITIDQLKLINKVCLYSEFNSFGNI